MALIAQAKAWGAALLALLGLGWLLIRQAERTGAARAGRQAAEAAADTQKEMLHAATDRPGDRADRARRLRAGDY